MDMNQTIHSEERFGLIVEPIDTLFFRDGRPFNAADHGVSNFPLPQTLKGMILTYLMQSEGIKPAEIHGLRDNPQHPAQWVAQCAIQGPWLARNVNQDSVRLDEVFVPTPQHLVSVKDGNGDDRLALLTPVSNQIPGWSSPSPKFDRMQPLLFLGAPTERAKPVGGFISLTGLDLVLNGKTPEKSHIFHGEDSSQHRLFYREERVGIEINDDSGTTGDGQIYSASHLRLAENVGFYAELGMEAHRDSPDGIGKLHQAFPAEGIILPFGGEGRHVRVRLVKPIKWPSADPVLDPEQGGHSMILISPVIFYPKNGADPTDPKLRPRWQPGDGGVLTGAAVGKPLAVSGWGMAGDAENGYKPGPKPTRFAVPAGSVYFWRKGNGANPDRILPEIFCLAERPAERAAGWGIALRGKWTYADK